MKQVLPLFICCLFACSAGAQTVDVFTAVKSGGWNDPTTWNPQQIPQPLNTGDKVKVIIPAGYTVNTTDINSPSEQEMIYQIDTIIINGTLQLGNPNASPSTDFFFDYPVYIIIENGGTLQDVTTASSRYGGISSNPRHVIGLQKGYYNSSTDYDTSAIVIKPGGKIVPACGDNYGGTYIYGVSGGYLKANWTYSSNPYNIQCPGPFPTDKTKTYIISVNYNDGSVTLPVTLVSFTGHYQSGLGVQLQWTTSSEYNSNYFAVERSSDGVQFQNIGEVPAQGNSQTTHSYGFTDASVLKHAGTTFYYRLREVDLDGKSTYSQVIAVQIPGFNELVLWPNPNNGSFNLQLPVSDNQPVELRIVNSSGAVVQRLKTSDAYVQLQLPNAASGLYFVQVRYPDGTVKTLKMLVVK